MKYYIKKPAKNEQTRILVWFYAQPYNPAAMNPIWGAKETAYQFDEKEIPKEFQTTDYDLEACPEGEEPVANINPPSGRRTATEARAVMGPRSTTEPIQGDIRVKPGTKIKVEDYIAKLPGTPISSRESILREAIELICKEREEDYGSPDASFATIANLWSAYLEAKAKKLSREGGHTGPALFCYLTPKDVAILNILQKVSRLVTSPDKRDGWVDIAGYAGLGWEISG